MDSDLEEAVTQPSKRSGKGVTWFIEGDIKSFFDNIDHQILAKLINKHFEDTRLRNLYWKFVKAGYME